MRRLGCKVISVGNVTVGGTGKTPMVIMLATLLSERGYKPAILSRGYKGRRKRRVNIVSNGAHSLMGYEEAGDEPALIARLVENVPVLTGKKRYVTGAYAIDHFGADVLILDDAFQHRSLSRDIDIVLLDHKRPFGNGFLLPRGVLREPITALSRADIVILTGTEESGDLQSGKTFAGPVPGALRKLEGRPVYRAYRKPINFTQGHTNASFPLDSVNGKRIVAFAGIAEPEDFRRTIEALGAEVVRFISFPDHHAYTSDDVVAIQEARRDTSALVILTTEKDGIKLADYPDFLREVFMLHIHMEIIALREQFEQVLLKKLEA